MSQLEILIDRLKKIGITLELAGNIPWIYLRSVNGNRVHEEDWDANYGFTIGWYPVRAGETYKLADVKKTFELIRKYRENEPTTQGFQRCKKCKKQTWHTPKLGLVMEGKRLCTVCNTSNKFSNETT
jgi:hypothetical protein